LYGSPVSGFVVIERHYYGQAFEESVPLLLVVARSRYPNGYPRREVSEGESCRDGVRSAFAKDYAFQVVRFEVLYPVKPDSSRGGFPTSVHDYSPDYSLD
jgi:hypothetical protein